MGACGRANACRSHSTDRRIISTAQSYVASLVEASPNFVAIAATDGRLLFVNVTGRAMLGLDASGDFGALTVTDLFPAADVAYAREVVFAEFQRTGRWAGPLRILQRAGTSISVDLTLYRVEPEPGDGDEAAIALIAMDVTERRRSELRMRALLDTGSTLTDMSDARRTFGDLAESIVRTMATLCAIDLFSDGPNGSRIIERVATFHIDRAWRGLGAKVRAIAPRNTNEAHPVHRVLRDGTSTLAATLDADWIDLHASSEEHALMSHAMRLRSLISVPLVAGGEVVGALTCALGAEKLPRPLPEAFDSQDLFFLEELGRRAGRSIETARLYERDRKIAQTLQAASLPQSLPSTDAVTIDAEYRPGNLEATIGGDWYDAFTLAGGRIVLTVGDVLGNGLNAAVTMTKLRQAMQSAAMVSASPNVMLDVADATLRLHAPEGYATAIAAIYDPQKHLTTIASAGHPGPLLRLADGTLKEYLSPGLLLGMRDGDDVAVVDIPTPPGSMLVFFTDGLTEATRDVDEGMRRIESALSDQAVLADPRPAHAIVEHVFRGNKAADDTAVLTLQFR